MLYVIQAKTGGPVKIGYTQDERRLKQRLSTLQCGSPRELHVIATLDGAGPVSERKLHQAFGRHRLRGEWFTYAKGIQKFVQSCHDDNDLDVLKWCAEYERAVKRLDAMNRRVRRRT